MERELSNNINMIRATLTFCGNNTSATSGIPAFAVVKGQADTKLVLLDGLNQTAGLPIGGVTTDTNIIRQAMSDISFKVGSAVSAYAASINNNTLRSKVTYTRTDYRDYVRRHDAPRWAHLRRCLLEDGVRAIERGIWSISTTHAAADIGEALRRARPAFERHAATWRAP